MSSCWRHLTRQMFAIHGFIDKLCSPCKHFHARDASGTMEPLFVRPDSAFLLRDLWNDESELVFLQCNLSPWTGFRAINYVCWSVTWHVTSFYQLETELAESNKISSTSLAPFRPFCSLKWFTELLLSLAKPLTGRITLLYTDVLKSHRR